MSRIPPRQQNLEDPDKRFYVVAPASVRLALQQEAFRRDTDLWDLGGAVLSAWLAAGCPDFCDFPQESDGEESPSPSSSPLADSEGGEA